MDDAFLIIRGIALGLLLALLLLVVLRASGHAVSRYLCLLAVTLACYALTPILYQRSAWFYPVAILSNWAPAMFLLFSEALFEERSRSSMPVRVLVTLSLLLGILMATLSDGPMFPLADRQLFVLLTRVLMTVVLLLGLYYTLRRWREDLVEHRRRLRLLICLIAGGYILVIVIAETLTIGTAVPDWLEFLHSIIMAFSIAIFFVATILLDADGFLFIDSRAERAHPPTSPSTDNPELNAILRGMEELHYYRELDLTIGSLAERLEIPEHRLRNQINKALGYRNFSEFLNRYRLEEVALRLREPEERGTPILTIAMDAGYRSMTTFNRAFKARYDLTPKEFRARSADQI